MSSVVHGLLSVPPLLAYLLVALLAFGESAAFIGFVLPGETALLFGGLLAAQGKVSLPIMMALGICAAIAGDSVGYQLGRRFGPGLQTGWLGRRIGEQRWARGQAMLLRAGGRAVLVARFVSVVRALMPSLAGMARMPYRTFLAWNAAGGVLWGGGFVLLGYLAGGSITTVERYLRLGWIPLAVTVGVVLLLRVLRSSRHRQQALAVLSRARFRRGRPLTAAATGVFCAAVAAGVAEEASARESSSMTRVVLLVSILAVALVLGALPPFSRLRHRRAGRS